MAHAWNACWVHALGGSNPPSSATNKGWGSCQLSSCEFRCQDPQPFPAGMCRMACRKSFDPEGLTNVAGIYGSGSLFKTTLSNESEAWCATYSFMDSDGKRKMIRGYGPTKVIALQRRNKNIARRFDAYDGTTPTKSPKLKALWTEFKKEAEATQSIRATTLGKYSTDMNVHVLPFIGNTPIAELTRERLITWLHSDLDPDKPSARTHAYQTLNTVLNKAVRLKKIKENPLSSIQKPKYVPAVRKTDKENINKSGRQLFHLCYWLQHHEGHLARFWIPVLTLATTGMRSGELCALSWSDVKNLNKKDGAYFNIHQQLVRITGQGLVLTATKNDETRRVPIVEPLRTALNGLKKTQTTQSTSSRVKGLKNPVFVNLKGNPFSPGAWRKNWIDIQREYFGAKFEEDRFRSHFMRHIYASVLTGGGMADSSVSELLGHKPKTMTASYQQLTNQDMSRARKILTEKLKSQVPKHPAKKK